MFVCADCYTICEGQEQHPNNPACDEFDGLEHEEEVLDIERSSVATTIDEHTVDIRNIYGAVALLSAEVVELQRKFDTIIAAVVKAAGPDEER